jgi:peptidoglycan/LPS O-acetylase OafA/YrhL
VSRHIGQFETLRGIAATWVFISHALLIAEFPLPLLSNGDLAVDVFVLLSGFVITLLVLRRPEPYGWYIFRRGIRLYPLYFIALMLGWATQGLYQPVIGESLFGTMAQANFFQRVAIIEASLPEHLALHLTMLHGAVPDAILPLSALAFSGPLWSISLEWQFYLVAPLLIWCLDVRQPGRIRWAAIAVVATIIINVISRLYWHADVPSFLPLRLPLFAAGIVSGVFWQRAQEVSLVRLGAILTGVAMLLVVSRISPIPLAAWVVTYWAAAAAGRSSWADRFNHFLMLKPLRWLGERSYGVYVLHMPVVLAISAWLIVPYARAWGQAVTLVALFACFPVVLLLAAVLYRTVERPVVNWAKRLGGGKPQVPVSDVTQKTRAAI